MLTREKGNTLVEYGFIGALVLVATIAVVKQTGVGLDKAFQGARHDLDKQTAKAERLGSSGHKEAVAFEYSDGATPNATLQTPVAPVETVREPEELHTINTDETTTFAADDGTGDAATNPDATVDIAEAGGTASATGQPVGPVDERVTYDWTFKRCRMTHWCPR